MDLGPLRSNLGAVTKDPESLGAVLGTYWALVSQLHHDMYKIALSLQRTEIQAKPA